MSMQQYKFQSISFLIQYTYNMCSYAEMHIKQPPTMTVHV
jgi:hypothetical protein